MSLLQTLLMQLVVASMLVGLLWYRRWPSLVLAGVLLVAHMTLLWVSLDARFREVAAAEMQVGGPAEEVTRLAGALKAEQMPDRVSLTLTGLGFFVLAVLGTRSQR